MERAAGRSRAGFRVGAAGDEVRTLAQRSAEAAKAIKTLVKNSSTEVSQGVGLVNDTVSALERIAGQVKQINDVVDQIADSSKAQASSLTEVSTAIAQIDRDTQRNAAMVEETTAATTELMSVVAGVVSSACEFNVSNTLSRSAGSGRKMALDIDQSFRRAG